MQTDNNKCVESRDELAADCIRTFLISGHTSVLIVKTASFVDLVMFSRYHSTEIHRECDIVFAKEKPVQIVICLCIAEIRAFSSTKLATISLVLVNCLPEA